jgi:hypothetical protein
LDDIMKQVAPSGTALDIEQDEQDAALLAEPSGIRAKNQPLDAVKSVARTDPSRNRPLSAREADVQPLDDIMKQVAPSGTALDIEQDEQDAALLAEPSGIRAKNQPLDAVKSVARTDPSRNRVPPRSKKLASHWTTS